MSNSNKSDAKKVADVLEPYTGHKKSCTFDPPMNSSPKGDYCTCGLSGAVEEVQSILSED